ncbi:MAG: ThuA domain-containing protein [Verrucomicrobiae bacterium]|nr:ThuA domain-containing protein [Verrucomicrobiae bacterium]
MTCRTAPPTALSRGISRLVWLVALAGLTASAVAAPKSILVVTVTKGFRHSSIPTAEKVLADLAQRDGSFTVDYARTDDDLARKMTLQALERYDGVIFANTTGNLPLPDVAGFLKWIENGKGFIGMHSATDTFGGHKPLHPYTEMINGEFKYHREQAEVEAVNSDPAFPSNRHFGPTYKVFDEIYILNGYNRKAVRALLDLDQHPNSRLPGHYPISWARTYGHGRVWYTSLGHREDVWESSDYQKHILGGIRWAVGLESGDATPQSLRLELSAAEKAEGFRPLFNGEDLAGWRLRNADGHFSWSAQNGMLVNRMSANNQGTDLVSEERFGDFVVRYEYMVPKGSNSGFYLRGRYEIQILDDHGNPPADGGNGGLYSIKAPARNVSKPAGQWQQVEATLKGNRVTVVLNGVKIHDDVELTRATGGQLDNNLDQPGPFMLQGDHGAVAFRNMRIRPL